jgi:diacylglycerol O-acyltransferase / wax synthase
MPTSWTSRCCPTFTDTPESTDAMIHAFGEIRRAAGFPGDPKRVDTTMAPAIAGG